MSFFGSIIGATWSALVPLITSKRRRSIGGLPANLVEVEMRSRIFRIAAALTALTLALVACSFGSAPSVPFLSGGQPSEITGSFTYTNDIITTYYVENAVALVDMYGFVKRDKEWKIPVDSQTLGFLQIDSQAKTGKYSLELPELPTAQMVDVDNNGKKDKGVQVF